MTQVKQFAYHKASRGDWGFCRNSTELVDSLRKWAESAQTPKEKDYVEQEVKYFLACGSITKESWEAK